MRLAVSSILVMEELNFKGDDEGCIATPIITPIKRRSRMLEKKSGLNLCDRLIILICFASVCSWRHPAPPLRRNASMVTSSS
jgi:hypothetical protein